MNLLKSFFKNFFIIILNLVLFISFLALWSCKIEQQLLFVNKKNLYIPDKFDRLNGLKIAVISDLHLGSRYINKTKLEKIVCKVNKQKPDLIFIIGDIDAKLIFDNYKDTEHIINQFKKLKSNYGTYAVYGNHDFYPKNIVASIYKKSSIPLIVDDIVNVNTKNGVLYIAGLNDRWGNNSVFSINEVIAKVPQDESVILLVHNPDVFPKVPKRVNLTISGHNHGGQICLPILGGLFIPSKYDQRYLKGYVVENNKHLYISSGIGNLAPIRFGNIPEVNILTLYSQNKNTLIENTKVRTGTKINLFKDYAKIKNSKWFKYINYK